MTSTSSFRRLAVIILAIVLCSYSFAEIHPERGSESVDKLFASSALVLRGEVKEISTRGSVKGAWRGVPTLLTTYAAQVVTDKTYKGPAASIVTVEYVRPEDRVCAVSACVRLAVGEFDYFFLAGGKPLVELRDPYFGKFRASRLTASRDRVGLDELKRDFVSGLEDPDEGVRLTQAELVGSSGRKVDAEYLKRLLPSGDTLTHATVYYALLRLGDYSALAAMRGFLEVPSNMPAVERLRFLCLSEINVIRDASAVDALIQFAKSPADDVREVSIHALRTLGSARTVPLFVDALDDKVQMIRYDAVLALAGIEQNWSLAPAVDTFQADEKKYTGAWKSWWATEGRRRYGSQE